MEGEERQVQRFFEGGPRFLKIVLQDVSPQTSSVVAIHKYGALKPRGVAHLHQ
jgi:hypothetical protein